MAALTLAIGATVAWVAADRERWAVAAGTAALTPIAAVLELWGGLRARDAEEWRVVRVAYAVAAVVATVAYAATTGHPFYEVSGLAVFFLPAAVQGGRLAGAWRSRRRERAGGAPPTA